MTMKLLAQTTVNLGPINSITPGLSPNSTDVSINSGGGALVKIISTFLGFLTTLAGLMFLIYFIFAALSWITAGGDKSKVEHARQQMTNAALGLIIVIASYAIAGIIGKVLGIDILNPVPILMNLNPNNPSTH